MDNWELLDQIGAGNIYSNGFCNLLNLVKRQQKNNYFQKNVFPSSIQLVFNNNSNIVVYIRDEGNT